MFKFSEQKQSVGELFKDVRALYLSSFRRVVPFAFAGSLVTLLPSLFTGEQSMFATSMLLIWISTTLAAVFNALIAQSMFLTESAQQEATNNQAWTTLKPKLNVVLLSSLCYYGIVLLSSFALIIPGIFFSVLLIMYLPLLIQKTEPILDLFKHSIRLVWGRWWNTLTVIFLVPVLASIFVYFIDGMLWGHRGVIATLFSLGVSTVFITPWMVSALLVQHHDLRLREKQSNTPRSIVS